MNQFKLVQTIEPFSIVCGSDWLRQNGQFLAKKAVMAEKLWSGVILPVQTLAHDKVLIFSRGIIMQEGQVGIDRD